MSKACWRLKSCVPNLNSLVDVVWKGREGGGGVCGMKITPAMARAAVASMEKCDPELEEWFSDLGEVPAPWVMGFRRVCSHLNTPQIL